MSSWPFVAGAVLALAIPALSGCSGGGEAPAQATVFTYGAGALQARVGEPVAPLGPSAQSVVLESYSISPALPAGLLLDPASGMITGTPVAELASASFAITGTVAGETRETELRIVVGPALPATISELAPGFAAELVADNVAAPVKMALAPDGRLFFNELETGNVQVIDPQAGFLPTPFTTVAVQAGDHRGLLGLALSPTFALDHHVFVMATFAPDGPTPARARVLRFTDAGGVATDETVIVDDLPVGLINDGGELAFDAQGRLLVTVGDVQDPVLAQDPASRAGKVLRYTAAGEVPPDNPDPASPVLCLGLRNPFALALHPVSGHLYGADNGPTENDELLFLLPGKNYGWGYEGEGLGVSEGFTIRTWIEVIAPTAIAFHPGGSGWEAHAGELFLASYVDEDVRRILLLGDDNTDFHQELPFLRFAPMANANKPLDLLFAPDGSLYVSTFTAIQRVYAL